MGMLFFYQIVARGFRYFYFNFNSNHLFKACAKYVDIQAAHTKKTYMLPKDGQELRPKHGEAIIHTNTAQQIDIKYYVT